MLRSLASDPDYYWIYRFSFGSPEVFENHGEGLWTYRPHVAVREAAVYAIASLVPPKIGFVVESDCRTQSNNLGLLQEQDVTPGTSVTLVLGNSFTAGEGGCPWFDRLQASRPHERLVNGGLLGTGVEQWRRLVVYLQDRGLTIKRVLAIAIGNDFKRPPWTWSPEVLACLDEGRCRADHPGVWFSLAPEETHDQLIARAERRYAVRFAHYGWFDELLMYLKQHSYLYKFAKRAGETILAVKHGSASKRTGFRPENEAALDWIRALGIPLRVVMVLPRDEIDMWGNNADTDAAVALLTARKAPYSWCRLTQADYMPYDGHPNRDGYDKLAACAEDALEQMERRSPLSP